MTIKVGLGVTESDLIRFDAMRFGRQYMFRHGITAIDATGLDLAGTVSYQVFRSGLADTATSGKSRLEKKGFGMTDLIG